MSRKEWTRRDFVRFGAAACATLAVPGQGRSLFQAGLEKRNVMPDRMSYTVFGRTGLLVSRLAIGSSRYEPEVAFAGLDHGINFVHSALGYGRGNTIRDIARAFKGRWNDLYFALKGAVTAENIEGALRILGTDHIDVIMPDFATADQARDPAIPEAFEKFKAQGKVRHLGFTVHTREPLESVVDAAVATGRYEAMITMYQPERTAALIPSLRKARAAGHGVMSMKTLQGAADDPAVWKQLVVKALTEGEVDVMAKGFLNFDMLNALAEAARGCPSRGLDPLSSAACAAEPSGPAAVDASVCGACGRCEAACPRGLAISEIMRCRTYYRGPELENARDHYAAIPHDLTAAGCGDCGRCEAACPRNLPVRRTMARAATMWG